MAIFTKQKKCSNCKKYVTYEVSSLPESCPYCSSLFWNKPNEERILFNLQKEYSNKNQIPFMERLKSKNRYLSFFYNKVKKASPLLSFRHKKESNEFQLDKDFLYINS